MNDYEKVMILKMAIELGNRKLNEIVRKNFQRDNKNPVDTATIESYLSSLRDKLEELLFDAADTIASTTKPADL